MLRRPGDQDDPRAVSGYHREADGDGDVGQRGGALGVGQQGVVAQHVGCQSLGVHQGVPLAHAVPGAGAANKITKSQISDTARKALTKVKYGIKCSYNFSGN